MKKLVDGVNVKGLLNKILSRVKNIKTVEILLLFFIPFVLLFSQGWGMDLDSWFILNVGRYIYAHGFPYVDPFTIHDGLSYVVQQWGYSVIAWPLYHYLGAWSLFVLELILFVIIIFLLYKLCMIVSEKNIKVSLLVTLLISIILIKTFFITMRPQMFTYINLLLYLIILESFCRNGRWKTIFWLIPVSIIQINFHAAMWWMLFIFAGPFYVEVLINYFIKKDKSVDVRLFTLALILAFFAGLLNPYGRDAINYFPNSFNPFVSKIIMEMFPTKLFSFSGKLIICFLILNVLIYIKNYKNLKSIKISYFILLFGTLILSLNTVKCQVFFYIGAIYPISFFYKSMIYKEKYIDISCNFVCKICYIVFTIICVYKMYLYCGQSMDFSGLNPMNESFLYLKNLYGVDKIRLYTGYDLGSYAEFEGFNSYIDTRAELFYKSMNKKEEIFNEMYDLQRGDIIVLKFLEKYKFTHLIVFDVDDLFIYDGFENYHLMKETEDYKIYERDDFSNN